MKQSLLKFDSIYPSKKLSNMNIWTCSETQEQQACSCISKLLWQLTYICIRVNQRLNKRVCETPKPLIESDYQSCRNLAPDRKRERLKKAWELNYCLSGRINRRKKCQRWFGWHACSLCQLSHLHSFFLWFRGWKTFYGNFVFNWLKWATILFYCKYTKSDWPPYCMGSLNRKC